MRGASLLLLVAPCGGGDPTPTLTLAVTPAGGISVALGELRLAVSSTFTPNMTVYATNSIPNVNLAAAFSVVLALATFVLSFTFLKLTQRKADS